MTTTNAARIKAYKLRRREAGFRRLDVLVPERVYEQLLAEQSPGESLADTLQRLLMRLDEFRETLADFREMLKGYAPVSEKT